MIVIQEKLVSEAIVEEDFVCNLQSCKGACCWEGDFGAPLLAEELKILESIQKQLQPYLTAAGTAAIEKQGPVTFFEDMGQFGTTLVEGGACAYMTYDERGVAQCGIENAWRDGKIDFQKPVSCHLYPVRVTENEEAGFIAVNYDEWEICSAACTLGKSLKVPVYQFVKAALIRRFGKAFYEELDAAAAHLKTTDSKG